MGYHNSRSVRFPDDVELAKLPATNGGGVVKFKYKIDGAQVPESCEKEVPGKTGKSLKAKVLSRVFSEDYERVQKKILDPRGPTIRRWNKIFLVTCLVSLFVDPLFFYLPAVRDELCIDIGKPLEVILTIVRSVADRRACNRTFKDCIEVPTLGFLDRLIAALPLPQVLIWIVIPRLGGSTMTNTKNVLRFIIIFQYIPRLFLIYPLSSQIVKATGVVTETAWAGAAYNLMLYMLASHVLGACWYLLSIERQEACWRSACDLENTFCEYDYFDCHRSQDPKRKSWFQSSNVTNLCNPDESSYQFGMYGDAVTYMLQPHCSSTDTFTASGGVYEISGQNLSTSTYVGEIMFAIIIATLGLVLFALLIGNMQTYLQSTTVRLEEWRIKRTDTEQWMRHRQLPPELRLSVRKYDQYKWLATRGVDEEALLKDLPMDLRRDIKRHLCLDLVRRITLILLLMFLTCGKVCLLLNWCIVFVTKWTGSLFDQMDERMLDAICERLKPALCTEGTYLVREGDPVNEMLFIIRGHLDSYTTNGGRTGFFNSCHIGPGDFCGEELLTWALDPRPGVILPSSTRTVKSISEVEAFALVAEDLKFVASQFRRLHSKQLRHKFRFYSHQWRLWAACFIQAAWRRCKKRREAAELKAKENYTAAEPEKLPPVSSLVTYAARLASSTRRGANKHSGSDSGV
ncbi:protein CNGC15b [Prunus yedoensis var. nudiflora]|uniref:Protein CNGC15b n=1 Tax=Prunus yedoensis var. nudiflora TaxID=2094558 RepID=A0A314V1Q0_PRUYE|nr:protein CNGC15b [Prunus yedoensis var. nudiflora]